MAKKKKRTVKASQPKTSQPKKPTPSLLDVMRDGCEYGSLVDYVPVAMNFADEIRRAISEIEVIRGRPLVCYVANVVQGGGFTAINIADDLPFSEMIDSVENDATQLDILIATPGGVCEQVAKFVRRMRSRFEDVAFIIPHMALSAGTIWALSGNEIFMDERAFIGPIDPQVQGKDGRYIPVQALFTLIDISPK